MFTGLIEDIGTLAERSLRGDDATLVIRTALPLDEVRIGDSIAVQGACLTVTRKDRGQFAADASVETLGATTLGSLRVGARVHLERALTLQKRLDGHIVQGHVDGRGRVIRAQTAGRSLDLWIEPDKALLLEIAPKGSIAVDGVSLTVNELRDDQFRLTLVPHTLGQTTLESLRPGDLVNLETDVLAKYVRRMVAGGGGGAHAAPPTDRLATLLSHYGYASASSRGPGSHSG